MGEGYIFAPLFGCLLIIKYMLYVLLFDVLFDLGVRQIVFLRQSSMVIIQYHPFGMSQGWGLLSQLLSLPLRSVRLPKSDALPPAQPVYACVSSVRHFVFLRLSIKEIIQYHPFGMSQGWGLLSQLLSLPLSSVSDALPLPNLCMRVYHG